jgi:predicted RNase H-like nuclease (RuvC/YqgF family)
MTDNISLEVVASKLDDLKEDIRDFRAEISLYREQSVARAEWIQRNTLVDERFENRGKEIAELRTALALKADNSDLSTLRHDVQSRRAPWWTWVTVALASGSFIYTFLIP